MIKPKNILGDILYVLVEMPDEATVPAKFFVLNAEEMKPLCDNHPKMNSVKIPKNSEGQFRDKWDKLSHYSHA